MPKRILEGVVVSDKGDKTVVVKVERTFLHPVLKKTVRRSKKYHAHDEANVYKAGETARITLAGVRFFLTHILDRPRKPKREVTEALVKEPTDMVLFGHSHLPHDESVNGIHYFNPASAGPRRFDYPVSVGIIEIKGGKAKARHVPLDARSKAALKAHMNQLSSR